MSQNGRLMTIGEVAETLSVPATTLRYYEREGILGPSDRSTAGYRLYDSQAVERIRFLRAAQSAGFTLADIQTLLRVADEREVTCRATVQSLITARLAEVQNKIKDLKRVQEMLELSLARCRRSKKACPVLHELSSKGKSDDSSKDACIGVGIGRRRGYGRGRGRVGETRY